MYFKNLYKSIKLIIDLFRLEIKNFPNNAYQGKC